MLNHSKSIIKIITLWTQKIPCWEKHKNLAEISKNLLLEEHPRRDAVANLTTKLERAQSGPVTDVNVHK